MCSSDLEGITGITHAFKAAGAHNLVMSLWVVDDQSSAELIYGFYRRRVQDSLPRALHEAKRELRASAPHLAHPFYWAPFVLMQ